MSLSYRKATAADAPALDALFDRSFTDTFGHLYAAEDLRSFLTGFGVDEWRAQIDDGDFAIWLAEDDRLAGYVKLGPMKLPVATDQPALLIDQFYLLAPWHGQGVAQALMDCALAEARRRGAVELYLSVFVDNHRARRFYEKYGFEAIGRYTFMVGNHADDDVIMRLML
jgi:ribosomal protein S18 acetylase RimI-like enzyme